MPNNGLHAIFGALFFEGAQKITPNRLSGIRKGSRSPAKLCRLIHKNEAKNRIQGTFLAWLCL